MSRFKGIQYDIQSFVYDKGKGDSKLGSHLEYSRGFPKN